MCRSRSADPFLVGLVVSREVHHKRWAQIVDIVVLLLSAGAAVAYIVTALSTRAEQYVSVDYTELMNEGKPLFEHFCLCNQTTIRWANFTTYDQYADSAYAVDDESGWCDATFSGVAGESGRVICGTAVYKLGALLNPAKSTWTLSSDAIISESALRSTLSQKVRDITFDAWNLLSDSMLITQILVDGALTRGDLSGNLTGFDEWTAASYAEFLKVESKLPLLNARILGIAVNGTLKFDNNQYIQQCQPRSCKELQQVKITTLMVAAAAVIASYISLFTAAGNVLLKIAEKGHVSDLVKKWREKTISKPELDFLRFNYPKWADDIAEEELPHGGVAEMSATPRSSAPPPGDFGRAESHVIHTVNQ